MHPLVGPGNISGMEIADSARKHGIADADILHALTLPIRDIFQGDNPHRVLHIGADRTGRLLEIVVLDETLAIHAMPLRRKFYRYL